MYEREQYTLKLVFDIQEQAAARDIAQLFSALSKANDIAQDSMESNLEDSESFDLIVNKVSLNSPLSMELIVSGLGAVLILIQILDRGGKFFLEREKLKLECQKLKYEIEEKEMPTEKNIEIESIISDFDALKHKLKSLQVEPLDGEER